MNYIRLLAVVVLAAVAAAALPAEAAQNDLQLYRLSYFDKNANRFRPDQASFDKLTNELGLAMAPKFLAPAASLGEAGFDVGFETSITMINGDQLYWKNVTEGGTTPSMLTTGQIHFRKGLPQSFEVGTTLTYLFLSQMSPTSASAARSTGRSPRATSTSPPPASTARCPRRSGSSGRRSSPRTPGTAWRSSGRAAA